MPFVTVTKPTRIFNPWFRGIRWYTPEGKRAFYAGFTKEIPPGSTYRTGKIYEFDSIPEFWPEIDENCFEITEWKNPNYVYFDWRAVRGYSTDMASLSGSYYSGYYGGAVKSAHESLSPRWYHNGEYYYKGSRIDVSNFPSSNGVGVDPWIRSYMNGSVTQSTPYQGRITTSLTGVHIKIMNATPTGKSDYSSLVAETEFAGLFRIRKYWKGGSVAWGDRYIVNCPLAFNVYYHERCNVKDWVTGEKFGPGEAGSWGAVVKSLSWKGSKPVSGAVCNVIWENTRFVYNSMMIGTNGDEYYVDEYIDEGKNRYELTTHRFRFEIPYGIE